MVLDIRKDLLQRKQKSQPKRDLKCTTDAGPSEPAENIEGPFSPPCSYDPLLFNLHNSLSREAQPRPLRVPCSACTFVPHAKQLLALSRNGLRCKSQPNHHKLLTAGVAHDDCAIVDEEPCAEDIAGDHRTFTAEHAASVQPIRVACSACTSSLRAPLFYGHIAVAPKVKPRKRAKRPNLSSTEAMSVATTLDCPVQDLHDDRERVAADCGWFVRPEQGPCVSPLSSAVVQRPSQSAATEKKKSINVVPVEAVHKVERVEGHSPHESIAVTHQSRQSCEDISEIIDEDTQLVAAGEKQPYQHDCFVKRVERACAKVTGSKVAGADKSRSSRNHRSSSLSRHDRWNSTANTRVGRPQQHASSSSCSDEYTAAGRLIDQAKDQGIVMAAEAVDHFDAVKSVIQAVSDIASISMQDKPREEKNATLHNQMEDLPSDMQKSLSASQEDQSAVVQLVSITGSAASKKSDQKMKTYEGAESTVMKKRSNSVNSLSMECASASQIANSDSHSQMEGSKKEQQLRLSVEVFPSPSAPKGFGLKIMQHFPKMVEVEYVNGLGLSPRSFQTLPCQQCFSSS